MNIHPLLVHFPIAFLTFYVILELISFKKLTQQHYWFYSKAVLLFLGVVGAGAAILAGQAIENQFGPHSLISLHSKTQEVASFLFGLLAIGYVVAWVKKEKKEASFQKFIGPLWKVVTFFGMVFYSPYIRTPFALVAFLLILIGSALGGIIAFGPHVDPFTEVLYNLLTSFHILSS